VTSQDEERQEKLYFNISAIEFGGGESRNEKDGGVDLGPPENLGHSKPSSCLSAIRTTGLMRVG
jgi:hypothetical protein